MPSRWTTTPWIAGLLGDLPDGRLLGRLATLQMTLGQAPLEPAGPVAPRDHGSTLQVVDHEPAGRGLLDHGQARDAQRGAPLDVQPVPTGRRGTRSPWEAALDMPTL